MTTFTFPTLSRLAPSQLTWRVLSNTLVSRSPLSGAIQSLGQPGDRWGFTAMWANLSASDAAIMRAFVTKLRGQAHRFTAPYWARRTVRGTLAGTVLVDGASQAGATLAVKGATIGTTLLVGDFLGVNGELHLVTANATADGAGKLTAALAWPLRASPADNAAVTYALPSAKFVLTANRQEWVDELAQLTTFALEAEEAFS